MAGKKGAGENSKKAAGQARKAEAAEAKKAVAGAKKAAQEDAEWNKGAKSNAKKDAEDAKKADAARKKAEKAALLAEEESSQRATPKGKNAKTAVKKTRGLDLGQLDDSAPGGSNKGASLNATGIDNALDALSLTANTNSDKIDRHPERRFKAAYAAFEERRLPEIEQENPGLRRQQRIDMCRKEFEKSPDNPFNQVHAAHNMTREEIQQLKNQEKAKIEGRLAG